MPHVELALQSPSTFSVAFDISKRRSRQDHQTAHRLQYWHMMERKWIVLTANWEQPNGLQLCFGTGANGEVRLMGP